MEIPAKKTQHKIAELLHGMDVCRELPYAQCRRRPEHVTRSAFFLGHLMLPISTEMFPAVRADERDKIAYHITAELVCCDIYERLEAEAAKGYWDRKAHQWVMPASWRLLRASHEYHAICHYGGWAASLAKDGPKRDNRGVSMPCRLSGGSAACKDPYWCPVANKYESPCHGGFGVCCLNPELHRPTE